MDEKKETDSDESLPDSTSAESAAHDAALSDIVQESAPENAEVESSVEDASEPAPAEPGSSQDEAVAEGESAPSQASSETADGDSDTEPDDEEVEAVAVPTVTAEQLSESRSQLVDQLLGERRLVAAKIEEIVGQHIDLIHGAETDLPTESASLIAAIKDKDTAVLETEKAQMEAVAATLQRFSSASEKLYTNLPSAAEVVGAAVEARSDEQLAAAGKSVAETLTTYRQGLEIIHRMLGRAVDRRPDFVPMEVNFGQVECDDQEISQASNLTETIATLSGSFHDMRDKNYHLIRDAKMDCEKQVNKAKNSLKQVLSAIDGIDGGLQNEKENRALVGDTSELEESANEVIASWFGAYDELSEKVNSLIDDTELTALDVQEGKPFDPETMEPQGVVENSEMKDDDVATVLRRGFSFCGELIRPALVEVVKNS